MKTIIMLLLFISAPLFAQDALEGSAKERWMRNHPEEVQRMTQDYWDNAKPVDAMRYAVECAVDANRTTYAGEGGSYEPSPNTQLANAVSAIAERLEKLETHVKAEETKIYKNFSNINSRVSEVASRPAVIETAPTPYTPPQRVLTPAEEESRRARFENKMK